MQAKFSTIAVTCMFFVATACHSRTVHLATTCTSTTSVSCTATADPDPLYLDDSDADKDGNFTVKWKPSNSSMPWLVQFPAEIPCTKGSLVQSGREETCVIKVPQMGSTYYKYFAFEGGAPSKDPGIAHDTTLHKHPARPRAMTTPQISFSAWT